MKLSDFPNDFEKGDRSCIDCKNFVVNFGEFKRATKFQRRGKAVDEVRPECLARCKKHALLVEDWTDGWSRALIREPTFKMNPNRIISLKKGYKHKHWNFANRCDEFISMKED